MKLSKLYVYFILLFVNITISAQSNFSGIIYYESTINGKKLDEYISEKRKNIKDKKLISSLDKVYFYTKPVNSKLIFSDNKGLFTVEDKLSVDINDLGQRISKISAGGSKEYFYDDKNKIYLIKDCDTVDECFIHENTFLKWDLTQESKEINGFLSYKATRSDGKVIAWYSPNIPIGFGPKGEYGLPGLILELEIGNIIFKASKILINPKEKIKVEKPKGGKMISYEEYEQILQKAKKSVFGNN